MYKCSVVNSKSVPFLVIQYINRILTAIFLTKNEPGRPSFKVD